MRHNTLPLYALVLGASVLVGCSSSAPVTPGEANPAAPATTAAGGVTVYAGGDILTMAGAAPQYVEALVVRDGRIVFAGDKAGALAAAGQSARQVDLAGKAMVPGFIDGHSHLLTYADSLVQGNLAPPPIGTVSSLADIVSEMQALATRVGGDDTAWLVGQGYDQDFLKEKRHPTAADLDAAFPTRPVALLHASGHMLVANSAALKAAGITAETPDPAGGAIIRLPGSKAPAGLVQETAMLPFMSFVKKPRPEAEDLDLVKRAVAHYASYGVTTAAEHLVMAEKMPLLEKAADAGLWRIDLVAAPAYILAKELVGTGKITWRRYRRGLKYEGLKLALDGSPQGKTAFLTEPYLTPVPGCAKDCKGFPNMTQADVDALFTLAYRNGVQIFAHTNGDASVDMMIAGHKAAEKAIGQTSTDRRTVIIHSQIMRPDQMAAYARLGLLPSFFTNHTYYWGDVHVANLGATRAAYLSPLKSALAAGIRATNHTDATVTPIDPLFLLWTSVNRVSRNGQVLGPEERVTPYEGLLALTANGAYEYFEEKDKGTLEVGKRADLVVLDRNPLKVAPDAIKDITVVETIKDGVTIHTAGAH